MQKNDIIDELQGCDNIDMALTVLEHLDSEWLRKEADKIRRKHGN